MKLFSRYSQGILLLILLVLAPSSAEEVFISNKAFKGETIGQSKALEVELSSIAKALDMDFTVDASNQVLINDQSLSLSVKGGKNFVNLKELCDALGLKLIFSPELDTADVYVAKKVSESKSGSPTKHSVGSAKPKVATIKFWPDDDNSKKDTRACTVIVTNIFQETKKFRVDPSAGLGMTLREIAPGETDRGSFFPKRGTKVKVRIYEDSVRGKLLETHVFVVP